MAVKIQLRRDTAAAWTSANPTLAQGELGLETDTTYYKIGDGATAWNSLAYGSIAGTLVDDSVTTSKILDANVTEAKLASDAVTTAKILDANVTEAKLAANAVTTNKILDANVTAAKLATDSVETAKIVDANVTTAKLANKSVTSAKIGPLSTSGQAAAYTFVLADAETLIFYNGASAANFTVPLNSSVAFPVGTQINVLQYGYAGGIITFVGAGGVTLYSEGSKFKTKGQFAIATLIKTDTDAWVVVGNTAA
jgi:hypothetical protein